MTLLDDYLDRIGGSVSREISADDHMFPANGDIEAYLSVGRDALRAITVAQLCANRPDPATVLDFGCGAGRVLRWLSAAYPNADITGVELRGDSLAFVAEQFGVRPVESTPRIEHLELPGTFDLIWVGSVFTHLGERDARLLLDRLFGVLAPDGLLVFTVHGRRVVQNQVLGRHHYIETDRFHRLLASALSTGFGHAPHVDGGWSGISVTDPAWVARWCASSLDRRLMNLTEMGWCDHQDVVAIARSAI